MPSKKGVKTGKEKEKVNPLLDDEDEITEETPDQDQTDTENLENDVDAGNKVSQAPSKNAKPAPKSAIINEQTRTQPTAVAGLSSDAKSTKKILDAEEKVSFMIPLNGEKKGSVHEVTINGHTTVVPKGKMVELPRSIVAILAQHYDIETEAGSEHLIEGDDAKLDALS